MLTALLLVTLQAPKEAAEIHARPVEAPAVRTLSNTEARAAVAALKKLTARSNSKKKRGVKLSLLERMEGVREAGSGSHEKLVKPLAKIVVEDANLTVRKLAAELLGNQPRKKARPALMKLLEEREVRKEPEVLTQLVRSLRRVGYEHRDWETVAKLFGLDFGERYTPLQEGIVRLVIAEKEKAAWKLLIEHIDEPAPVDPSAPDNPPAEYWKRRWEAWRVWRADVKEALFVITGQRFSTRAEAKIWIDAHREEFGRG